MNLQEDLIWKGDIEFSVFDEYEARKQGFLDSQESFLYALKNGWLPIKRKVKMKNTVTNYGRQGIAMLLTGAAGALIPNQMELGTGSGTPSTTDTDLWSPTAGTLKQCQSIQPYLSYYGQFICTWLTTDNPVGTWTEIGLKDSNHNLWAHSSISITINSGEALSSQWSIQIVSS